MCTVCLQFCICLTLIFFFFFLCSFTHLQMESFGYGLLHSYGMAAQPVFCTAVESPNKGHFGGASFVLCQEIVLFRRFKMYWNYREKIFVRPQAVSFVEQVSLFWSVRYRRFHCIPMSVHAVCSVIHISYIRTYIYLLTGMRVM